MEELMNELLEELKIELEITEEADIEILTVKLKNAIREIKLARGYSENMTEEFILKDLQRYIANIKDLTMYDYATIGHEGENAYSENGINRTYKNRKNCFNGIARYCNIVH